MEGPEVKHEESGVVSLGSWRTGAWALQAIQPELRPGVAWGGAGMGD